MDISETIKNAKKQRLSLKLQEMGAKYGNDAVIDIVAAYAATLTQKGRDALIQGIKDCDPPPQRSNEVKVLHLWGYQDSDLASYLKAKAA